jgi:uncharacterized protein
LADLNRAQKDRLLCLVGDTLREGVVSGQMLKPNPDLYEAELQEKCASFVTLRANGQLRGCIGTLEACEPLVNAVADAAFGAAFRDPRFPRLAREELNDALTTSISLLTTPEPLAFSSERELLDILQAGDGLILEEGFRRATFLPGVWETIDSPREFLRQLKRKANMPVDYWSPEIKVSRYYSVTFAGNFTESINRIAKLSPP